MRKKLFREHKKLENVLSDLSNEQIVIFDSIFSKYIDIKEYSISKMFRMSETLICIIKNNDDAHENLFIKYYHEKSAKEKLKIKYGNSKIAEYTKKLKDRNRPIKPFSIFDYKFWINRGFTEDESKKQVAEIQRTNVKKRTKTSYVNFSEKLKFSLDYWTKIGYSKDEAELLRTPYLKNVKNDLESLIEKHGNKIGIEKYTKKCLKYKESMLKNIASRRVAGYVSKESLRFFIPLYKFCRKLGIKREEIFFGIKGSREYFIRDNSLSENGGKFYDFCIPKLSIIVEYHGTFWHPKDIDSWKNPWIDYHTAKEIDSYKVALAKTRNMEYYVIWSDDDHLEKMSAITGIIERKYNE